MLSRDTPHASLSNGARLGDYEILRRIGQGGIGSVFEVRHVELRRRFAAKVVTRKVNETRLRRLRREARVAGTLQHPNIVDVVHLGRAEPYGVTYVVMELLVGCDLGDHLCDQTPAEPWLPMEEARTIGHELLDGLAAAHAGGVVHRDLKPENIYLAQTPHGQQVKILDFGLASHRRPPTGGQRLTGEHQILGTPAYMAPEQARSSSVDARADVYSVSVILYELLTGRRPFDVESPNDVFARIALEEPHPPSALRDGISPEIDRVVLRGLERRPSKRFADAGEMRAAWDAAWGANTEPDLDLELSFGPDTIPDPVTNPTPRDQILPPTKASVPTWVVVVALAMPLLGAALWLLVR